MDFWILGQLEVKRRGALVPLGGPKQQKVLAMLLLEANRAVPVTRLAEAIWGDAPPATAGKQVQNAAAVLRRTLGNVGLDDQLTATRGAYRITVEPGQLDAAVFDRAVAEARNHARAGHSRDAVSGFRSALALWRGPALTGLTGDLIEAAATRLDETRLGVVEECTDLTITLGEYDHAITTIHEMLAEHPFRERLVCQLMRALHQSGRSADAVASFEAFRERLADELGIDPGADLVRLHDTIVRGDAPSAVAPARPRPVAVHHVTPVPAQLPADVATFTGRRTHLSTLDSLVSRRASRPAAGLAVITGTAGVGKTALAVHWAHQVRPHFADGQLYVNLRGYDTSEPVSAAAALARCVRALGVPSDAIPTETDELSALYRSLLADRRVLVVLDNANDVTQVRPLLPGSASCLAMVTSRDTLRCLAAVEGATTITLDVLTPAESRTLLGSLLGDARVHTDQRSADRIAELCGHLPLALRIAAANIADAPDRSLAQCAAELAGAERLAHLTLDGDPRAAVAATFELSYTALPGDAKLVFRRLGLLPGPDFTAPAAAAVSDTPVAATERILARLTAAHLVEKHCPGRYRLHDLLRLYARQCCDHADSGTHRHDAHTRLLGWYRECVRAVHQRLHPTQAPAEAVPVPMSVPAFASAEDAAAWLATERANLIAAVTEVGDHPYIWRLAEQLRHHLHATGDSLAALECGRAGLAAAVALGERHGEAAMLLSVAQAHRALGANDQAIEAGLHALGAARDAVEPHLEYGALTSLGLAHFARGDLPSALEYERQSLAVKRSLGLRTAQAASLGNIAMAHHALGEFDLAHRHFAAAWLLVEEAGEVGWQASTLQGLADLYRDQGHYDEAIDHARRALALARETGDRRTAVFAHHSLGTTLLAAQQPDAARPHLRDALALAQTIRVPRLQAETRLGMAAAHRYDGDTDDAHEHAAAALELAVRAGSRLVEGEALTMLAAIALDRGELEHAIEYGQQALPLQAQTGHRLGQARSRYVLGGAYHRTGRPDEASKQRRAAKELFTAIGTPQPADLG